MSYDDLLGKLGHDDGNDPLLRFRLTDDESLVLSVTKLWLMREDRQSDTDVGARYLKWLIFGDYANATSNRFETRAGEGETLRQAANDLRDARLDGLAQRIAGQPPAEAWDGVCSDVRVVEALWDSVNQADRARLLLLELAAFSPWADGARLRFNKKLRRDRLRFISENLGGNDDPSTASRLDEKLNAALKHVRKVPRDPLRVGTAVVGGAIVGAVSGGLAAPALGSAIGGTMGLSGAAATNAGLALLGGGSIASGGFGMAGGTALVSFVSAGGGGAAFAQVQRVMSGLQVSEADVAADCAKLLVLVDEILLERGDDRPTAELILDRINERLSSARAKRERVGGSRPSDRHADELTRIITVLDRTANRLQKAIAG